MDSQPIGVIGAGVAGLSCAQLLKKSGHTPLVLEKSRGIGGRLATRRTDLGFQFDHGAQFITAQTSGFDALLEHLTRIGAAGEWPVQDRAVTVGVPSMNAVAKEIGAGLDIRRNTLVTSISETGNGWRLATDGSEIFCEHLVITVPQPQALTLLGAGNPLSREISHARMSPCWTLMAAFSEASERIATEFTNRFSSNNPLAWIALNSSKPGRQDVNCWVAQADADWSADNLERDPEEIKTEMLFLLCDELGLAPSSVRYASAHRWRFANVETPLGKPFVRNSAGTLYLGGDWCLDACVEAAWQSGVAIAENLLEHLNAS